MISIIIIYAFRIFDLAIFAYCILSWFVRPGTRAFDIYRKLGYYLEPTFKPARMLLSRFNLNIPIDLAPWLTLVLASIVCRILLWII